MAVGDLITGDWEMEYNDLLIGGDSDYAVAEVRGLLDLNVRTSDRALLRRHGLHPGEDFLSGRTVTVAVEVYSSSGLDQAVQDFLEAFVPAGGEQGLAMQLPGIANGAKVRLNSRVRRRSSAVDLEWYRGIPVILVELEATDPRLYAAAESSDTGRTISTTSGGLTWPLTWPLAWGTAASGTFVATNAGNFETPATFTLSGPLTNPRIENVTQGKTLDFGITLSASETLVVDTAARTVLLGGTASRYSTLTTASEWFQLGAGGDTIRLAADSGSGSMDTTWRSAWV